jgi:hypothetical protein
MDYKVVNKKIIVAWFWFLMIQIPEKSKKPVL